MKIGNLIFDIFKRSILYQYLLLFSILRLTEAFRFHHDFYYRLTKLFKKIGITPNFLNKIDTEIQYKLFLISIIILSSLSILGLKIFIILTGITSIFTGFLYFYPDNSVPFNITSFKEEFSIQFLLFITLGIGIISSAFNLNENLVKKFEKTKDIKENKEKKVKKE